MTFTSLSKCEESVMFVCLICMWFIYYFYDLCDLFIVWFIHLFMYDLLIHLWFIYFMIYLFYDLWDLFSIFSSTSNDAILIADRVGRWTKSVFDVWLVRLRTKKKKKEVLFLYFWSVYVICFLFFSSTFNDVILITDNAREWMKNGYFFIYCLFSSLRRRKEKSVGLHFLFIDFLS